MTHTNRSDTFSMTSFLVALTSLSLFAKVPVPPPPAMTGSTKVVLNAPEVCENARVPSGSIGEFVRRHTVQLLYKGVPECTGTAIKSDEILLAAHCFRPKSNPEDYVVRVYVEKTKSYKEFPVQNFVATKGSGTWPDMGMVQLSEPVPNKNVIPPATEDCLDQKLVLAGFGWTEKAGPSTCVRHGTFTRQAPRQNAQLSTSSAEDRVFFAVPETSKTPMMGCTGDSGGPVYCRSKKNPNTWIYAGLFTSVLAKPDDLEWQKANKNCRDSKHPEQKQNCLKICSLAEGIAGYVMQGAEIPIDVLRQYIQLPRAQKAEPAYHR